jgi:hypothetical protein
MYNQIMLLGLKKQIKLLTHSPLKGEKLYFNISVTLLRLGYFSSDFISDFAKKAIFAINFLHL